MAIEVSTAQLLGTFLEVLGFGIYLVVGPKAFLAVRQKRLSRGFTMYLYSTMIVTFILIVFHLVIDLIRAFVAFTAHTNIPNAPETYFANVNTTLLFIKSSTVVATTLVADILLIHRTLVVWDRRWWVLILPVILYCLDVVTSIWFTWSLSQAKHAKTVLDTTAFARAKYFFAASLAVNLVCTCLIAYRIWAIQNAVSRYISVHHRVRNALSIVLESAAIYTADLVCMIILSCIRSGALFVFLNSMPPLIGLVFTFVVLRSSSEDNRNHRTETRLELRSNNVQRPLVTNERIIDVKPTSLSSEGVRIHFETIIHHDAEHEQEYHV